MDEIGQQIDAQRDHEQPGRRRRSSPPEEIWRPQKRSAFHRRGQAEAGRRQQRTLPVQRQATADEKGSQHDIRLMMGETVLQVEQAAEHAEENGRMFGQRSHHGAFQTLTAGQAPGAAEHEDETAYIDDQPEPALNARRHIGKGQRGQRGEGWIRIGDLRLIDVLTGSQMLGGIDVHVFPFGIGSLHQGHGENGQDDKANDRIRMFAEPMANGRAHECLLAESGIPSRRKAAAWGCITSCEQGARAIETLWLFPPRPLD